MSDFDKEAEREKLREKYAEEEKDRETTQHMSELLLQGATMTNKHCDTHGDPIFRYEGEEFCPTCQQEGRSQAGGQAQAQAQAGGQEAAGAGQGTDADASQSGGRQVDVQPTDVDRGQGQPSVPEGAEVGTRTSTDPAPANPETGRQPSTEQLGGDRSAAEPHRERTSAPAPQSGSLDDAEASLVAALGKHAAAAAETDDPRKARESLAAAREAAEALSALRR